MNCSGCGVNQFIRGREAEDFDDLIDNRGNRCRKRRCDFEAIRDIREGMKDIHEGLIDIEKNRIWEGIKDIQEGIRDTEEGLNDISRTLRQVF